MKQMVNLIVRRWVELTKGQKKTLWFFALLSPLLPLSLEFMQSFINSDRQILFSTGEIIIYSWVAAFLPLIAIALLARFSKSSS